MIPLVGGLKADEMIRRVTMRGTAFPGRPKHPATCTYVARHSDQGSVTGNRQPETSTVVPAGHARQAVLPIFQPGGISFSSLCHDLGPVLRVKAAARSLREP